MGDFELFDGVFGDVCALSFGDFCVGRSDGWTGWGDRCGDAIPADGSVFTGEAAAAAATGCGFLGDFVSVPGDKMTGSRDDTTEPVIFFRCCNINGDWNVTGEVNIISSCMRRIWSSMDKICDDEALRLTIVPSTASLFPSTAFVNEPLEEAACTLPPETVLVCISSSSFCLVLVGSIKYSPKFVHVLSGDETMDGCGSFGALCGASSGKIFKLASSSNTSFIISPFILFSSAVGVIPISSSKTSISSSSSSTSSSSGFWFDVVFKYGNDCSRPELFECSSSAIKSAVVTVISS